MAVFLECYGREDEYSLSIDGEFSTEASMTFCKSDATVSADGKSATFTIREQVDNRHIVSFPRRISPRLTPWEACMEINSPEKCWFLFPKFKVVSNRYDPCHVMLAFRSNRHSDDRQYGGSYDIRPMVITQNHSEQCSVTITKIIEQEIEAPEYATMTGVYYDKSSQQKHFPLIKNFNFVKLDYSSISAVGRTRFVAALLRSMDMHHLFCTSRSRLMKGRVEGLHFTRRR